MAFDNRQRVTRLQGAHGPMPLLIAVAVVVLGATLVLGGAFDGGEDLKVNTAIGTTTLPSTSTTLVPDTSIPEELVTPLPTEVTTTTSTAATTARAWSTTTMPRSTGRLPSPSGGSSATTDPPLAGTSQAPATAPATTRPKPPPPTSPPPTEAPAPAPTGNRMSSVESELLHLTNGDRSAAGVGPLSRNSCLDSAAAQWAAHMAETGQMAHSTQSGRLVEGCRGTNASWGDNVGWWDPCAAGEMENWWMNSPGHRANIVNDDYDNVGIAVIPGVRNYCWFQVLFSS